MNLKQKTKRKYNLHYKVRKLGYTIITSSCTIYVFDNINIPVQVRKLQNEFNYSIQLILFDMKPKTSFESIDEIFQYHIENTSHIIMSDDSKFIHEKNLNTILTDVKKHIEKNYQPNIKNNENKNQTLEQIS
jgi:hypothetical protein